METFESSDTDQWSAALVGGLGALWGFLTNCKMFEL
jgi:hypothetical protein